nr:hypothetical protein [Tanacetum cinerariifolium]
MNTADGANRYGGRATGAAPGNKSIRNSTFQVGGIPGKSLGKTSGNSRTTASNENLKEQIEDQPLPADASPIALSPSYVVDSDPEEDEEDPKEDPANYPADRGDNDDDESSDDDDDDDDVEKEEEEEEHLALADPSVVSTNDPVPLS